MGPRTVWSSPPKMTAQKVILKSGTIHAGSRSPERVQVIRLRCQEALGFLATVEARMGRDEATLQQR